MNDEELDQLLGNDMNCNYHLPKEFDNDIKHEKSDFSISLQCQKIIEISGNICLLLSSISIHFSVMDITETWLSDHNSPSKIDIDSYSFIRADRTTGHGGGGGLYDSISLSYKMTSNFVLPTKSTELLCVEIEMTGKHMIICVVYTDHRLAILTCLFLQ